MGSCAKDTAEQTPGIDPGSEVASKLIFTSQHAIKGQLAVCFDEIAADGVEASVLKVTRAGGIATRSGIGAFDAALENIGVVALQRVFPVDSHNEESMRAAGLHRWYMVEFADDVDLDQAALSLAGIAEVSKIQFNLQLENCASEEVTPVVDETDMPIDTRAPATFNDPNLWKQWHYTNTGNTAIYPLIKAGADANCGEAWKYCTGDPRIVVAVLDDCVNWAHEDLAANMWVNEKEKNGTPGVDDDGNGYIDDVHGYNFANNSTLALSSTSRTPDHGTHVGGTVAAVNNNGKGVCGVAGGSGNNDGVKLMSCQMFYNIVPGSGASTTMAKAIIYAANNGACILQCSLGYPGGAITSDAAYASSFAIEKQAIDYFISKSNCEALTGGLVIFAAGNESANICGYPGACADYISVTAMSCTYAPAAYTNYGPGCNVAAPGGDGPLTTTQVYSTLRSGYGFMAGTSMACPHVSGIAALGLSYALQQGKKFTRSQFTALLLTSVNEINQYCKAPYTGKMGTGYIDAFQVLMNVRGTKCIPVSAGTQYTMDVQPLLGSGDLDMKILSAEFDAADMTRLGVKSAPIVFGNKVLFTCHKPGSAIIKVKLLAGISSGGGVNGMTITKEFAVIARENQAANGGWL